jgi:hypothetical protein
MLLSEWKPELCKGNNQRRSTSRKSDLLVVKGRDRLLLANRKKKKLGSNKVGCSRNLGNLMIKHLSKEQFTPHHNQLRLTIMLQLPSTANSQGIGLGIAPYLLHADYAEKRGIYYQHVLRQSVIFADNGGTQGVGVLRTLLTNALQQ